MTPQQLEYFRKIKVAKENTLAWAKSARIPLIHIEHVATFETWDRGIEVWCFFETEAQHRQYEADGVATRVSDHYRAQLKDEEYSFDQFPEVLFHFDSREHVDSKFEGNYFYRVR